MKRMLVRYRTKAEQAEQNERLIAKVFEELHAKSPEGARYLVLKLEDNTFLHFVTTETADGTSPIPRLEAFRFFQEGIKERCIEPPQSQAATVVGSYRMGE
jgi:hypothetical protein